MRDGICPKCDSRKIHTNETANVTNRNRLHVDAWSLNDVMITTYVCGNCGYLEQYVMFKEELDMIVEKWPTVG